MSYTITLIVNRRDINIPVLPSKLEVSSPGKNDKTTVIKLGEILILKKKGLRSIGWKSFFPVHSAPYVQGDMPDPAEAVKAIQDARDKEKPIRLLITGADLDFNTSVGVESFNYDERAGEVGDLYYDIKLTEWKDYSPKRIILPPAPAEPAQAQEPERSGEPEQAAATTYTVKSGDSLWAIAQKHYGSGSRWNEIYQANKGTIGSNPNLIYPGQVYTIP